MKRKGILFFTILLLLAQTALLSAAALKNVTATITGNRVLFKYDLDGSDRETEVTIHLNALDHDKETFRPHLEGDLGKVKPGTGKAILWDVLKDYPSGLTEEIDWEIFTGPVHTNTEKGVWGRLQVNISPVLNVQERKSR